MRITVKSNFGPNKEMETESATLGDLLNELSRDYNLSQKQFVESISRPGSPLFVFTVNGKKFDTPPAGLKTQLEDGDKVEIYFIAAGGG